MGKTDGAPESITVECLQANGTPVLLEDLGMEFMKANGIDQRRAELPFRVAVDKKLSKAGNAYYDYSQNSVPLPDGLATLIRVQGSVVPVGKARPSRKGHPTSVGRTQITIGGVDYSATVYITEGRTPYFLKVIAHKTPDRSENIRRAQQAPRGGRFVL